ncbi:MAG: sulfite exporter TauE/SafE family protein, partial [Proteobacteria bacterium]|nr:sulfite exporter TauE/SafE family protein [Pseudomonadota bacterium]
LLAAGLSGRAVVATDAGISVVLGLLKVAVFQGAGALPPAAWLMALLIGVAATPGAFIAKRLTNRLSLAAHAGILDAVVILGGGFLIVQGLRA